MNKSLAATAIFSTVALTGCNWTWGTPVGTLEEDITCTSEIVDQTIVLKEGEKLFDWDTNTGQPYHGLKREFIEQEGAITITTQHEIKMYDHDRWVCKNNHGTFIDYKTLEPLGTN